ncbi:MAG: glycosyltransferase family 4 protein [Roseimicrobium sp.]
MPQPQNTRTSSTPVSATQTSPIMASGSSSVSAALTYNGLPKTKAPMGDVTLPPIKSKGKKQAPALPCRAAKGRLLWIGDAAVPTGFATVTHSVLQHLCREWEVIVSGVNYEGGAHPYPYHIMPARQGHGDMWGMNRFVDVCAEFAPDVVIINNDWWNVAEFLQRAPKDLPLVAYMPVDGANLDPAVLPQLNGLAAAVWYCDFGHQEAARAGFTGQRHVVPHGMDAALWQPVEKNLARELLGLSMPQEAFIVGNVNRNQPRKRLDLSLQFFADWVKERQIADAYLLLHCAKRDSGWDLERLARHHGISDRLILTGSEDLRTAPDASRVRLVYSALDVQITTTLGEGWGLTTMEGMACGVPQIVPDWAALGEWALPALKVPCSVQMAHPEINTIGALPDKAAFIAHLDALYRNQNLRAQLGAQSTAFVHQPCFQWSEVARQLDATLQQARHTHSMPREAAFAA